MLTAPDTTALSLVTNKAARYVLLCVAGIMPASPVRAYERAPPESVQPLWDATANIGDYSGFAPAGCSSGLDRARLIGTDSSAIAAYLFGWMNEQCTVVSACQTMRTERNGACNWAKEFIGTSTGALYCPGTKFITGYNNAYCPAPVIVPSYSLGYVAAISKNCGSLPGTRFDERLERCACESDSVWVPEVRACKPVSVKDISRLPRSCAADLAFGNPIHPLDGVKKQSVPLGVKLANLALELSFTSQSKKPAGTAGRDGNDAPAIDGIPRSWASNFHRRLAWGPRILSTSYNHSARVTRGDGSVSSFSFVAGQFLPDQSTSQDALQYDTNGSGHLIHVDRKNNRLERYDNLGNLLQITSNDGRAISFFYRQSTTTRKISNTLLTTAIDNHGRELTFDYVLSSADEFRLASVTANRDTSSTVRFQYDGYDNLAHISWPDGRTIRLLYETGTDSSLLTGLIDESNTRLSTYTYLPDSTAASTSQAGGVNEYSVTYLRSPTISATDAYSPADGIVFRTLTRSDPQSISVFRPNGSISIVSTMKVGGVTHLARQSQPAGAGCAASAMSRSFDAKGNVVSQNDFNGNRVCHAYDTARNLELTRVEGLTSDQACSSVVAGNAALPENSRKISHRWHPDWSLIAASAEPGRIITLVYNGQPDPLRGNAIAKCAPDDAALPTRRPIVVLCRQIEQATNDPTGTLGFSAVPANSPPPRIQAWTYNSTGQVLSHDGPRIDVPDVARFAYYAETTSEHTTGDPKSEIDAVGKITQYLAYDRAGRLLRSQDQNGTITAHRYDLRGRRISTMVGAEITSFSYDAVGQLTQITRADGDVLKFQYDIAQRPVGRVDVNGHRVVYTLDAMGNRVLEQYIDTSGVVRREISRSFDALGRVQSVTGNP